MWPRCGHLRAVDRFLAENRAVHLWGVDTVLRFLSKFTGPGADADLQLKTFKEEVGQARDSGCGDEAVLDRNRV